MELRVENLEALDRLKARFAKLANPDARGLMQTWMEYIRKDNERGVLAGEDKHGGYMVAVTYRPKPPASKLTKQQKNLIAGNRRGVFAGIGTSAGGYINNNLSPAEYRRLSGPPLAPRGKYSRVITNLKTEFDPDSSGPGVVYGSHRWKAYGYWDEVVNVKGQKFLQYHFHGIGQIQRDLTGLRPDGMAKARAAMIAWMKDIVRSSGV